METIRPIGPNIKRRLVEGYLPMDGDCNPISEFAGFTPINLEWSRIGHEGSVNLRAVYSHFKPQGGVSRSTEVITYRIPTDVAPNDTAEHLQESLGLQQTMFSRFSLSYLEGLLNTEFVLNCIHDNPDCISGIGDIFEAMVELHTVEPHCPETDVVCEFIKIFRPVTDLLLTRFLIWDEQLIYDRSAKAYVKKLLDQCRVVLGSAWSLYTGDMKDELMSDLCRTVALSYNTSKLGTNYRAFESYSPTWGALFAEA